MLSFRRSTPPAIQTDRMSLRLPELGDHAAWSQLRRSGESFLRPWEPTWSADHFSRRSFRNRVYWAWRAREEGKALALFLIRREDRRLVGAITLDNIRRGPSQSAQVGYWVGQEYSRQGYMREALAAVEKHNPVVPVIANVRAAPVSDADEIAALLVEQVTGQVRWRETVEWFAANNVTQLYEIGSG